MSGNDQLDELSYVVYNLNFGAVKSRDFYEDIACFRSDLGVLACMMISNVSYAACIHATGKRMRLI